MTTIAKNLFNYFLENLDLKPQEKYDLYVENGFFNINLSIANKSKYKKIQVSNLFERDNYYSVIRYEYEPLDLLYLEAVEHIPIRSRRNSSELVNFTSRRDSIKAPLIEEDEHWIKFSLSRPKDLTIQLEDFFENALEYTINLSWKKRFDFFEFRTDSQFYGLRNGVELEFIVLTENSFYNDSIELQHYDNNGELIYSGEVQSTDKVRVPYIPDSKIVMAYQGDLDFYPHRYTFEMRKNPVLLDWFVTILDTIGF